MKRYETDMAKQEAIDTLRDLMNNCTDDEAFRRYSKQYDDVLSRPVAPEICAHGECRQRVQGSRSYCADHSSASWLRERE